MSDRSIPDDLPRYVAGSLPPAERARVKRALEESPALRAELAEWRALSEAVREDAAGRVGALPSLEPTLEAVGGTSGASLGWTAARILAALVGLALLLAAGLVITENGRPDHAVRTAGGLANTSAQGGSDSAIGAEPGAEQPVAGATAVQRTERRSLVTGDPSEGGDAGRDGLDAERAAAADLAGAITDGAAGAASTDRPIASAGTASAATSIPPAGRPGEGQSEAGGGIGSRSGGDGGSETSTPRPTDTPTTVALPTVTPTRVAPTGMGRVVVNVDDPDGPVPEARVIAHRPDGSEIRRLEPMGDGRAVGELPSGQWLLYADADRSDVRPTWTGGAHGPLAAEVVSVDDNVLVERTVRLPGVTGGGVVRGRLLDDQGSPLPHAMVLAQSLDGGDVVAAISFGPGAGDYAGSFVLPLSPGGWRVGLVTSPRQTADADWWALDDHPSGHVFLEPGEQITRDVRIGERMSAPTTTPTATSAPADTTTTPTPTSTETP